MSYLTHEEFSKYKRRARGGYCLLLVGAAFMGQQLVHLYNKLDANVSSQVTNRTKNVETWCGALNKVIDADREVLDHFHIVGIFPLNDLNCTVLAQKTLDSASH